MNQIPEAKDLIVEEARSEINRCNPTLVARLAKTIRIGAILCTLTGIGCNKPNIDKTAPASRPVADQTTPASSPVHPIAIKLDRDLESTNLSKTLKTHPLQVLKYLFAHENHPNAKQLVEEALAYIAEHPTKKDLDEKIDNQLLECNKHVDEYERCRSDIENRAYAYCNTECNPWGTEIPELLENKSPLLPEQKKLAEILGKIALKASEVENLKQQGAFVFFQFEKYIPPGSEKNQAAARVFQWVVKHPNYTLSPICGGGEIHLQALGNLKLLADPVQLEQFLQEIAPVIKPAACGDEPSEAHEIYFVEMYKKNQKNATIRNAWKTHLLLVNKKLAELKKKGYID
jgi:hypothetical protein